MSEYDGLSTINIDLGIINLDIDNLQKIKDNFDWFYSNYHLLKKYYENQYVAVKDKKFLDNDEDFDMLIGRLNLKDYNNSIAIDYVYK